MRIFKRIVLSVLTLFLLITCCSCSRSFKYYVQYTQDVGEGLYTFTYPSNYDITLVQLYEEDNYSCVDIYSIMDRETRTKTHWQIEVSKNKYLNASDAIVQFSLDASVLDNYEKISDQNIKISGIDAREITYKYMKPRTDYETRLLKMQPVSYVLRDIIFEYNDDVWVISQEYSPVGEPQDDVWFANFVESFVINQ